MNQQLGWRFADLQSPAAPVVTIFANQFFETSRMHFILGHLVYYATMLYVLPP